MALGSPLIQKKYSFSDKELVEEIKENTYLQFFIGLPGYIDEAPFVPSLLMEFRKKLNEKVLVEINEIIIEYNKPTNPPPNGRKTSEETSVSDDGSENTSKDQPGENRGTLIVDATCAPQNIRFTPGCTGETELARSRKNHEKGSEGDKRIEYIDSTDCVAVERAFSLSKRSFGMGLIRTRFEGTTRSSISLSIIAMNIDKLAKAFLCK